VGAVGQVRGCGVQQGEGGQREASGVVLRVAEVDAGLGGVGSENFLPRLVDEGRGHPEHAGGEREGGRELERAPRHAVPVGLGRHKG
jgi:hypothetical protein